MYLCQKLVERPRDILPVKILNLLNILVPRGVQKLLEADKQLLEAVKQLLEAAKVG
jgi:hypothetical protein